MRYFVIILVIFCQCSDKAKLEYEAAQFENTWNVYLCETKSDLKQYSLKENSSLVDCKKDILDLNYNSAIQYTEKDKNSDLEYILFQFLSIEIILKTTHQKEKLEKIILYLEQNLTLNKNHQSLLIYTEFLRLKAQIYKSKNQTTRALASLHYALYLLEKDSSEDFLISKAKLLKLKASILVDERGNYFDTAKHCFLEATKSINKERFPIHYGTSLLNLYYLLIQNGYQEEANKTFKQVSEVALNGPLYLKMYYTINKGFDAIQKGKNQEGINYFLNGLAYVKDNNCDRFKLALYSYLAEEYLRIRNLKSSHSYINNFNDFKTCEDSFKKWVDFYKADLEYKMHLNSLDKNPTPTDLIVNTLLTRRQNAKELFPDRSEFHLGDFYAQNTSYILNTILHSKDNKAPSSYHKTIRNLFNETKSKSENLAHYTEDKFDRNYLDNQIANKQLDTYLREINDFKDTSLYERIVYEKIYFLLESIESPKIDLKKESEKLNSDNSSILHTLKYQNTYFLYLYQNNNLYLNKVNEHDILNFLNYIKSNNKNLLEYNTDSLSFYKHVLLPENISSENKVTIIPDGLYDYLPIDLLFLNNNKFIIYYDYKDRSITPQEISKDRISVFSFSDLNTINSGSIKKMSDLYSGYQESVKISSLFEEAVLYSGIYCTIENLKKSYKSDLLHISTHGVINTNKRGDNYLLFRKGNINLDSLFISDIAMLGLEAKFISLAACETTKGMHLDGSGVFSLSKAFLKSGTQTVLKTLWKVDDKATKEFMVKFYEYWLTGISVLDAQFQTKQFMIDSTEFSHPYYWAGFALEGNPNLYLKNIH